MGFISDKVGSVGRKFNDYLPKQLKEALGPNQQNTSDEDHRLSSSLAVFDIKTTCREARIQRFRDLLFTSHVNLPQLCYVSGTAGIPETVVQGQSLRPLVWKIMLGYIPTQTSQWEQSLKLSRQQYEGFCQDLMLSSSKIESGHIAKQSNEEGTAAEPTTLESSRVNDSQHPLTKNQESHWVEFFQDAEVLEQIERDVTRTHPDMHFFSGEDQSAQQHRSQIMRALFIFAKTNRGLRYVQGMNEVYAPLYYSFRTDKDPIAAEAAEADAFFCFMKLLQEFQDNFCKQMDDSETGIRSVIDRLSYIVQMNDKQLWQHIWITNKINPQFFAFRWITLLLTQELTLPDIIRIWDTIISQIDGKQDMLLRVCAALLIHLREELLQGDFATNLHLLQNCPPVEVQAVLDTAYQIRIR